jgi:hypothetical protein
MIAKHPGRSHEPGEDRQVLEDLWAEFEQLVEGHNDQLRADGKPPLTWNQVAELAGVRPQTFSDWRNNRKMTSNYGPIAQAAEKLGGDKKEWLAKCRVALEAHKRLVAAGNADPVQER